VVNASSMLRSAGWTARLRAQAELHGLPV